MKAFIVLKSLVLLLIGFNCLSFFPAVQVPEKAGEHRWDSPDVEDGFTFEYESNLLEILLVDNGRYVFQRTCDFTLSSGINKRIGLEYFSHSNIIQPGLSTEKIIFPFHSFL